MNAILEYLDREFTLPVRDPLWRNINFSPSFKKLLSDRSFQRLGRIKQLGPAFHVYPGAVHTRLNHSLGVFHVAGQIMRSLLSHNKPELITIDGLKAFLCAALFHDLGHFPFAHSLKELPLTDHETLSSEIILSRPLAPAIKEALGIDPSFVAAIINEEMSDNGNPEIGFYRQILSGVLDPDKLDYLNRDAFFCGVPYGIQDADFIIHKLTSFHNAPALDRSGILAVENLLFSKYLMYKAVYWHKTVRIATGMIKKALFMALQEGIIQNSDLYNIDDEQFFQILSKKNYRPFSLIERVLNRNFYKSVIEVNFDPANHAHSKLLDLNYRFDKSVEIASKISQKVQQNVYPESVIIDIPEPISFEIDVTIMNGSTPMNFTDAGSVFTGSVVKGFTSSLRKVRLFVPETLKNTAESYKDILF